MHAVKRYARAGGVAAVAVVLGLVASAGAGAQAPPFNVTPGDPEAGEDFTVSGQCFGFRQDGSQAAGTSVDVFLTDSQPADQLEAFANNLQHVRQDNQSPPADPLVFDWSVTMTVPADIEPETTLFVSVYCLHPGSFNFDTGSFGVGVPQQPTTTTTTTTTPPATGGSTQGGSTSTPAAPAPTAEPAPSVVAEPTVTG